MIPQNGGRSQWQCGYYNWPSRRSIGDEVRKFEGLAKGGDKGKVPIHKTLGQTGECDKVGVSRGTYPNGTDMDDNDANYEGQRVVESYGSSISTGSNLRRARQSQY